MKYLFAYYRTEIVISSCIMASLLSVLLIKDFPLSLFHILCLAVPANLFLLLYAKWQSKKFIPLQVSIALESIKEKNSHKALKFLLLVSKNIPQIREEVKVLYLNPNTLSPTIVLALANTALKTNIQPSEVGL